MLVRYETGRHIIISSYTRDIDDKEMLRIEGVVTDAKTNETLVGATVMLTDGTKTGGVNGTITDVNGKFSLQVPRKASIKVSYMGYESVSLQITRSNPGMRIALKADGQMVEEVVVTGLSKRSKSSFTGNYVSVKGERVRKLNPQQHP